MIGLSHKPPIRLLTIFIPLTLFVVVVCLLGIDDVFAQTPGGPRAAAAIEISNTQSFIYTVMWAFVSGVFGFFTWATGMMLDWAIEYLVLGFGDLFIRGGLGVAVNNLWTVVRDLFNLGFIFGLIYIGFRLILDAESSAARKAVVNLVIAALLVNFSLFITKTVIDFSNIAAVQVSQLIYTNNNPTSPEASISIRFANAMGISTIWGGGGNNPTLSGEPAGERLAQAGFVYIFGTMILFIIAAFSFAVGALLLIHRFIVLNFLMILSPLMFLGFIYPGGMSISKNFFRRLLNSAFFAPFFLLMLYFSIYVLQQFTSGLSTPGGGGLFTQLTSTGATVNALASLMMGAGFLIGSVIIAQRMASASEKTVLEFGNKWTNKIRGSATNAALAGPRWAARSSTGWAATKAEKINNRLQSSPGGRRFKKAVSIASLGAFTERERLAAIEAGKKAKFGGSRSYQDDKDYKQKLNVRSNNLEAERKNEEVRDAALEKLEGNTLAVTDLQAALKNFNDAVKKMSKDDKADWGIDKLKDQKVAVNLSDSEIEHFEKSGKFSNTEIQSIKDARNKGIETIAKQGSVVPSHPSASDQTFMDTQRAGLVARSVSDAGKLPVAVFKEKAMYPHLTPAMVEERIRNGVGAADRKEMRAALESHLNIAPGTIPTITTAGLSANNPWVKWAGSNSSFAALFFS